MFYPKSPFVRNPIIETEVLKRNPPLLKDLLKWLCQTPGITTYRVNLLKSSVDEFKIHLKKLLAQKYAQPPQVFTLATLPEVVCIDSIDAAHSTAEQNVQNKQIVVDSCCGAALLRGAHIYAPGVLAMEAGTKQEELVDVYADLAGQCKKGTNKQYESEHKTYIGLGRVIMQRYQLYGDNMTPTGVAVEMLHNISQVPTLGDLSSNQALLQNLPSIVCVRVLAPQPGERVLDMCAAPGNKTTHIAEMMADMGEIIALDKTESKIKYVHEKIAQYGYQSIHAFAHDATKSYDESVTRQTIELSNSIGRPPYASGTFDRILLDAPCSALGNRPLLACNNMSAKMLQSYPKVQRKLFENAVQLLKPQGVLVYSTCTITEAENEELVAWALRKWPQQLELVDALPYFGGPGLPNLGLDDTQRQRIQRFGPRGTNKDDHIDTVGFFIAKFRKQY